MKVILLPSTVKRNFSIDVAQTIQLKFPHKPGITLRPGGASDISRRCNRRTLSKTSCQPRRGDRTNSVCRPSGAGILSLLDSGGYAALHHRLISSSASGAKTCIETLVG